MTGDVTAARSPVEGVPADTGKLQGLRSWLDVHVYRLVSERPPGGWLVVAAIVVLAGLAAFLRIPLSQLDALWAEDGAVFLQEAFERPDIATVVAPYNGYLHLLPRTAALIATWVPLESAALALRVIAAVVVAGAAWAMWVLAEGHLRSPWLRAGLTVAAAVAPAAAFEAIGNVANSHFWLLAASVWALVARRPKAGQQVLPCVVVALAALSTPLSAVLLPLSIGRLVGRVPWRHRAVALVHVAAVALQVAFILSTSRTADAPGSTGDVAFGYALRVVTTSFLGLDWTGALVTEHSRWPAWTLAAAVALVLCVVAIVRRSVMLVVLLGLSLTLFVVTSVFAIGNQYPPTGELSTVLFVSARYAVVPSLLLVAAWLVAAQHVIDRISRRTAAWVTAIALLPVLGTAVWDYRAEPDFRAGTTSWSGQVDLARETCRSSSVGSVRIDIAPERWGMDLDCHTMG